MTIRELEDAYQQLRAQLLHGELDEAEFKAEVEKLQFVDDQGDHWKIGWYTGNWYRYDQGQWVQGQPQARRPAPSGPPLAGHAAGAEGRTERRSRTPYLMMALILILLLASAALLIGWNSDWWARPAIDATEMSGATTAQTADLSTTTAITPTSDAAPSTITVAPSPTRVAQLSPTPSRTALPTPTASPPPPDTVTTEATTPSGNSPSPTVTTTPTPSHTPTTPAPTSTPRQTSTGAPPTQAPAAPKPSSGQIYFPVYDANPDRRTVDIQVFRLATGQRELMIGQASQPALSPDGKRLAYRSLDTGQRGILVRELDTGNTWRWISFHEAEHPGWSPDGQSIVFSSQQESDRKWRLYRTWGLDFDRVHRQGGDIFGRVPIWASDGRIIYWECPLDKCGLYAIHPDGTNLTRLSIHEYDTAPAVSPGGNRLAFMSNISGNWEIYMTNAHAPASEDGQEPIRLTNHAARDGVPAWSPDGQWLAFASDRDGTWALWVMRPDGSARQKLLDLGGPLAGQIDNIPLTEQHGWTWETIAWGP
jgi:hypothetical protein